MATELEELMALARRLPPMSPRAREEQALDFAYGNLAASTHHKPTREAFADLARARGWTDERFERWALGRAWRTP
jgi:hypothetical protein